MRPTDALRKDHDTIELALQGLDGICRTLEGGGPADVARIGEILGFLRDFADGCHHRKEEDFLFPALERLGLPSSGGPVAVMLAEHEEGRRWIAVMSSAVAGLARKDNGARRPFLDAAHHYRCLLRSHIQKENGVLFPMAERVLGEEAEAALGRAFASVDGSLGENGREKYETSARELGRSACPAPRDRTVGQGDAVE